ncbi:hypothetical protein K469DRAFT_790093 [Zopfia rhizophila CBS 207.26]|uniref:DDE-1 domain-containing protein n=1 Tax=Zopfia rhizophila CBS 207.26 TaxID=1314779 RepID=A0A6A6DRH0_9PEZI|nr:hypothetical protein K469DRAFT_790093 [Zopfia rhizophila CBS 207.26]
MDFHRLLLLSLQVSKFNTPKLIPQLIVLQHFNEYTRPHIIGIYRLLILDGHDSYVSLSFIQACEEVNIIPLYLSSHTTHVL